jgi:hypothetical protein
LVTNISGKIGCKIRDYNILIKVLEGENQKPIFALPKKDIKVSS